MCLQPLSPKEQWQKLKPIDLDLNIYDKSSLKETILGIIYRLNTAVFIQFYWETNNGFKAFRRWFSLELFYILFKRLIKNAEYGVSNMV